MEHSDWAERWRAGRIGFHQSQVTASLAKYADQVWGPEPLERVFVPLCGKTLDLVYLAERAKAVVGVEYVEQAVKEFFAEQGLSPEVSQTAPRRYAAGNCTLFAADVFDVTGEHIGPVDGVFDRAALVALSPDTRPRYAEYLQSLLTPGGKILLVTFDYDQNQMTGPPFAVSNAEVDSLFGRGFAIEPLETSDILNDKFRQRGLTAMSQTAFALTRG